MNKETNTRIAGWLIVPLAWLLLNLLTNVLVLSTWLNALFNPLLRAVLFSPSSSVLWPWLASVVTAVLMLAYTGWVSWLFCQRSRRVTRHFIVFSLLTVLLAVKSFAFSPVSDHSALFNLLITLLAASTLVPYFKRSRRVKVTFTRP